MPILDQYGTPLPSANTERLRALRIERFRTVHGAARRLVARYDAAQTTDENSRHWANADYLSAQAAASPGVRRTLRARGRYEMANNSYLRGIVNTLANDTIGTGPRLQMLWKDPTTNSRIEQAFNAWSRAAGLARKLRLMRIARCVDGEGFGELITNLRLSTPVKLDLRLSEAEQVTTPTLSGLEENAVDGIRFDQYGQPIEYHRLKYHPGGDTIGLAGAFMDFDTVPAERMIHLFSADRPGQKRGIPEITPALPLFAQLRRYMLAVIAAAETAADFAGVMYTDSPALESPEDVEAMDAIELEMRAMLTLPAGWKMSQMKAEQPPTTFEMFLRAIIKEVARCLTMPYNIAAGDSSDYNYASGRLDHQTYYKSIGISQNDFENEALDDRILPAWWDEAILVSDLIPVQLRGVPVREIPHQWFWDGTEHVDPDKESKAQDRNLANGSTSYPTIYAKRGLDYEVEHRKQAAALGITLDEYRALLRKKLFSASAAAPEDDEETEDEEQKQNQAA